jgi:hypothetical protein
MDDQMISILIPTRGRREGLLRAIRSARQTASDPRNLEFVCYLDQDDAETYKDFEEPGVIFIIGPRIVLSNMWNKCAEIARSDGLMQGNDDIVFRTNGWDSMVSSEFAKFPDGIVMVHGNDGSGSATNSGKGTFGTHPFVTRRWYDVVGYFTPPFYASDFGDTHLNDVSAAIGRRRYIPFVVEHLHYAWGKAAVDQTTSDRLARHAADNVEQLYKDLAPLRQIDIEKLKAAMR